MGGPGEDLHVCNVVRVVGKKRYFDSGYDVEM